MFRNSHLVNSSSKIVPVKYSPSTKLTALTQEGMCYPTVYVNLPYRSIRWDHLVSLNLKVTLAMVRKANFSVPALPSTLSHISLLYYLSASYWSWRSRSLVCRGSFGLTTAALFNSRLAARLQNTSGGCYLAQSSIRLCLGSCNYIFINS